MKRLVYLMVLLAASKGFQLQGPLYPIPAQLGGSILLPCSVETPLPLEELEVEWRRTDSDVLVHLFQEGEERPESQDYAYRGRAHFFSEEFVRGNYSIELNNMTREDAGVYICKVYTNLDHSHITAEVYSEHFLVTGGGVVSGYAGEEVVLNCSVNSHIPPEKLEEVTWKRRDKEILVLLYQDGEILSDSSDTQYRGRAEFFTTEIPKGNFSLRLKDVRTEDRGEYVCEAYSGDLSANTTVLLQELGFSNLHRSILVLCSINLLCTPILIVPAWMSLQRKDTSQRSLMIHLFLILCPNTILGVGFILWGVVEGFLGEAAACSTVNFLRFLLLIKTAPYLDILPESFKKLKTLSITAEISVFTIVVCSVIFRNLQDIFEQLKTIGKAFMGSMLGILILLCVSTVIPDFMSSSHRSKDLLRTSGMYFSNGIWIYLLSWGSKTLSFDAIIIPSVMALLVITSNASLRCCLRIPFGYILWVTFMTILIVLYSVLHIYYVHQVLERHKEWAGLMAAEVLLQILLPLTFFDHPKKLPEIPHAIVYMLGASGLSTVNSVTLLTVLISKAGTGERNVADLRVVVLLAESVFICCWMPLQLYSAWMRNRHRFQRNPNQRPPPLQGSAQAHEMETLTQRPLNGANQ